MNIIVYGKTGCARCEAAKDKLRRMGFDFDGRDLAKYTTHHDGWRDDGSVEAMAEYSRLNHPVPLILIDGRGYDYSGAMKKLKAMAKEQAK